MRDLDETQKMRTPTDAEIMAEIRRQRGQDATERWPAVTVRPAREWSSSALDRLLDDVMAVRS